MTAPALVDIGTLLHMKPSPAGGRLCVAGTGISVRMISILYNEGLTPEQIIEQYPHLKLPGVHAAIAHYLANKERMDAELEEDQRAFDAAKAAAGGKPVRYQPRS
jgi:uncharacterized protein (DUF433 family)